ncbi:MAG: GtrA family protein [Corynebacterium sp.]|uniref:GtrA family protein n=2 Tax=Corynebacterium stationis TaxID=1705 RepID=A0AB36CMY5_9CORY|nr:MULTISPECIES: GtrA family protein [Corynebacterium]NME90264.1 GtrA family protein [Corynebacterium stationis]NWO17448.1 GtrA family protein [Corynebacterium sp.]WLP87670.1 GtrA family protein [Corynebacterium stationis]HHT58544.1 GtrA family protein [Corynebacterium stationis]
MTSEGAERLAKSNSLRGQSTKFAITGGISAVIDAGLTWIFQIALALLGNIEARSVGFFFGTLTAYLLNRRWTFRAQPSKRRFAMVALTYALTYAVNIVIYRWAFPFFDHTLDWRSTYALVAAFILAQGTATVINFFVQRWLIFRNAPKIREV